MTNNIDFNKIIESMFRRQKPGAGPVEALSAHGAGGNSLFNKTEKAPRGVKAGAFAKLFRKKEPYSTGLDIGTSAVKSVTFSNEGGVSRLVQIDSEEIPREHFESAARASVVTERIKRLQARGALRGKIYATFDLPDLMAEFMCLPAMPDDELAKAVRWEAKEKFLVDEEGSVIDYLVLGEVNIAQQAQKEIFFFSAPRKDILENYRILSGLGVKAQAIRPNFLSSLRAFENKSLWKNDEAVGFLDIGAGSSQFVIISAGCAHFYRRLNVSGDSITRSIADYCRISYEEAEMTKRDVGMSRMALEDDRRTEALAGDTRVRVSHAMGLHLDQMITEIQHTFNYFSLQVSAAPVANMDRLIITGGGASAKGICEFFRSRLNMPVEALNPFNYLEAKLEGIDAGQLSGKGPRYAAAIGLGQSADDL